jgi:hypothetical protein
VLLLSSDELLYELIGLGLGLGLGIGSCVHLDITYTYTRQCQSGDSYRALSNVFGTDWFLHSEERHFVLVEKVPTLSERPVNVYTLYSLKEP